MVDTRIKPYDQQVAEKEAREQQSARVPAQPGLRIGDSRRRDLSLVAAAHQSQVDLSRGVVAMVKTGNRDQGPGIRDSRLTPSSPNIEPLVVILLGPTGSGKTALSLALRSASNGEIVSCDSVAVYRGMELGTAKPTLEERARVPHHLIDVAEPNEPFTAGAYSRAARAALRAIAGRRQLPIVTGGTGLYLRALTEGLFAGPARQEDLRARLRRSAERHGSAWLHRLLHKLDAATADRIHANDAPKLIRAIEVCLAARRPMSQILGEDDVARDPLTGFRLLRIGLDPPRDKLYARLNQRCAAMFAAGLVDETRDANPTLWAGEGIGFAGLSASAGCAGWDVERRSGDCGGAAGASQLRQAADDVVPARAGGALDGAVRRRC